MSVVCHRTSNSQSLDDEGCRKLWASVLYLAVRDCNNRSMSRAAMHYVFSPLNTIGSMRWICDMLDLDFKRLQQLCSTREGRARILRSEKYLDHFK
jgi:hypothetical protein